MQFGPPKTVSPFEASELSGVPLYGQVMAWLIKVIESDFSHEQRFFTERELIDKLGVSQPTVRRAMQELVNRGLLRRHVGRGSFVQKYAPTRLVGIIAPQWHSTVLMEQINAIASLCGEYNCNLRVHHTSEGVTAQDLARTIKTNPHEERMILIGHTQQSSRILFDELSHRGIKSVCAAPFTEGYPGSSVSVDTEMGVRIALDHLAELGHKRIAFIINEPIELIYIRVRLDALRHEIAARGMTECIFIDCHTPLWTDAFTAAFDAMAQVRALRVPPTAIVPLSGVGAWAVLRFATKHGIRLPEEFSVFAFDDIPGSQYLYPALTSLSANRLAQATELLNILWSDSPAVKQSVLPPQLMVRESTKAIVTDPA